MKFCAIICEYNPFHNGHLYHIQKSKELTGCDAVICVMGGNFNQRGLPCVIDKYTKANIAINNGADVVVELPTAFCTQSAEIFSLASIKILNSLKNVTHICFGSECGNIETLTEIANYLINPPESFNLSVKENLKNGLSYPASIEKSFDNKEWKNIISKPNNLLAIEYLKALKKTNSLITAVTIKRESDYNSKEVNGEFVSATAIRNEIKENNINKIKNFVPENVYKILKSNSHTDLSVYNKIADYNFIISNKNLSNYFEINEGIENYLKYTNLPTTRYRVNKINRAKLNVCLKIKKQILKTFYNRKNLPYIKVLAIKKQCINQLKSRTNLIIRNNNIPKNKSKYFSEIEQVDNNANLLYNLIFNTLLTEKSLYEKCLIK